MTCPEHRWSWVQRERDPLSVHVCSMNPFPDKGPHTSPGTFCAPVACPSRNPSFCTEPQVDELGLIVSGKITHLWFQKAPSSFS